MAARSPQILFLIICLCVAPLLANERHAIEKLDAIFGSYKLDEAGHVVSLELAHGVHLVGQQMSSSDVCELLTQLPHLKQVSLTEHQVGDAVLIELGRLANLQELSLSNTTVSDRGLRQLLTNEHLKKLYLEGCGLTDESLEIVSQLAVLEDLGLRDNTLLTDRGLGKLSRLKKLQVLRFRGSQFSGLGIDQLVDLPITTLGLGYCELDSSAMNSIGKMKDLQGLFLVGTQITDESLSALIPLPIEFLALSQTPLTDDCMNALSQISTLKHLRLADTEITEASVDQLRKLENLRLLSVPRRFTEASRVRLCVDRPTLSVLGGWNVSSVSHMAKINAALLKFHDTFRSFPATTGSDEKGLPRLSWRVAILPYIGEWELFEKFDFDEPWDSPHNLTLLPLMPKLFSDPQRPTKPHHTVYQAAIGEMTLLRSVEPSRLEQATDGPQVTITLVQTTSQSAVPWTSPQDYQVDLENSTRDLLQDGIGLAALADENFRTFDEQLDPEILSTYFTRDAND